MEECLLGGQRATLLAKSDGCSIMQFENHTGEGTMTCYEIFPGTILTFNDFHMEYFDSEYVPQDNIFAIDYCREGRMEYLSRNAMISIGKSLTSVTKACAAISKSKATVRP